jgi:hypothetical protein
VIEAQVGGQQADDRVDGVGQQWRIVGNGAVVNPHSGKCLAETGSGSWLEITACPSIPALGTSWHVF